MGTRADFYVRQDKNMEWLGSIAYDGYEVDKEILDSTTSEEFKNEVQKFLDGRDDSTKPDQGWPWPWKDSRTTDYAYIFEDGKVMASVFGYPLFDPLLPEQEREEDAKMDDYFPDMSEFKNVATGNRSGMIAITTQNGRITKVE